MDVIAPVDNSTIINFSTNKIQNGDILVPSNPGSPGKMAVKMEKEKTICFTINKTLNYIFFFAAMVDEIKPSNAIE